MRKDLRALFRDLEQRGWSVEVTGGNHYKLKGPRGQIVFCPGTPSDHRALKNLKAMLRRQGAEV